LPEKNIALNGISIRPERLRALRPEVVDQLAESIHERGLINPITVRPRGQHGYWLIAGRHRYMAVKKLKLETIRCSIVDDLKADEVLLLEIDENLIRADLTPAEEALHIDRRKELYETLYPETKHGGAPGKAGGGKKTKGAQNASFAKETSRKTGKSARKVQQSATRGKRGKAWLSKIAGTCLDKGDEIDALIKLPTAERNKLIEETRTGKKVSAKTRLKQVKREAREQELGAKQQALPNKKYGVILADPEWRFEPWSRETGMDRAADNHYPTSLLEVIKARDVESIAAQDCVLFLWATGPMNPHALAVMAAWGFDYKAQHVWEKDTAGTGYWTREQHELFLIGTRGNIPCPAPGKQWSSIIKAPRGKPSEKPECFLEMIEQYYPNLPKIELNRRGPPRPGWDAWGLEAQQAEAAE
jgi:N6-adenosine-specific RNA methylase IME4/uncharacterized ParB-like nuclease family protein